MARLALEADGFVVVGTATDGASAVAEVLRLQPDIVLLDVGLPDMTGFEVASRLREAASPAAIVLASSREQVRLRDPRRRLGRAGPDREVPPLRRGGQSSRHGESSPAIFSHDLDRPRRRHPRVPRPDVRRPRVAAGARRGALRGRAPAHSRRRSDHRGRGHSARPLGRRRSAAGRGRGRRSRPGRAGRRGRHLDRDAARSAHADDGGPALRRRPGDGDRRSRRPGTGRGRARPLPTRSGSEPRSAVHRAGGLARLRDVRRRRRTGVRRATACRARTGSRALRQPARGAPADGRVDDGGRRQEAGHARRHGDRDARKRGSRLVQPRHDGRIRVRAGGQSRRHDRRGRPPHGRLHLGRPARRRAGRAGSGGRCCTQPSPSASRPGSVEP